MLLVTEISMIIIYLKRIEEFGVSGVSEAYQWQLLRQTKDQFPNKAATVSIIKILFLTVCFCRFAITDLILRTFTREIDLIISLFSPTNRQTAKSHLWDVSNKILK